MKFNTHFIQKFGELYSYRDEPEQFHALADIYWRLLVMVTALIAICSLAYGAWLLSSVTAPQSAQAAQKSSPKDILNKSQLTAVNDGFTKRNTLYTEFKTNVLDIKDPAK